MNNVNIKQCRRADYVSRLFKEEILLRVGQPSRRKKTQTAFSGSKPSRCLRFFSV